MKTLIQMIADSGASVVIADEVRINCESGNIIFHNDKHLESLINEVIAQRAEFAIGTLVMEKMKSGNSIPVERCTIRLDEINHIIDHKG
jgi:hypothetical protein